MIKPIEEYVRSIPDFPEPGIIFRDVTSILEDGDGLHLAIDLMQEKIIFRYVKFKRNILGKINKTIC